jgi:homocysteine S-methyltransferase
MRPHTQLPIAAIPNAGGPERHAGRVIYPATPEYFADHALAFVEAGASLIGGCCGSTPDHIRAMSEALARGVAAIAGRVPHELIEHAIEASPDTAISGLGRKLAEGAFVVAVEMDPPRGAAAARLVAGAETLREAGADVINVADSPMARMRMSPWAACHLIQEEAGVETVLHFPTRGRNILRIQGDLLAAHALGIRNLFVVMGDPTSIGDHPEAADRADLTPSGLVSLIKGSLNAGVDRTGASIGDPTHFIVGCAVNVNAADLEREARVLHRKAQAGADFALSQAVFEPARLRRFVALYEDRYGELRLPILAGILPLVTRRHAEFLHNEVPGIDIPEEIRERMSGAGDKADREGLRIAAALIEELRERAAGAYLIPPFGRYDLAAELVETLRGHK